MDPRWKCGVLTLDLNHLFALLSLFFILLSAVHLLCIKHLWFVLHLIWTTMKHLHFHVAFNVLVLRPSMRWSACVMVATAVMKRLMTALTAAGQSWNWAGSGSGRDGCCHVKLMCIPPRPPPPCCPWFWCVRTPEHPPVFQCLRKCRCRFTLCQLQGRHDSMLCSTCYWHMWCLIGEIQTLDFCLYFAFIIWLLSELQQAIIDWSFSLLITVTTWFPSRL